MLHLIALLLRRFKALRSTAKEQKVFEQYKSVLDALPKAKPQQQMLLIRLDDIGDYLLWQQCLPQYLAFAKEKNMQLTLLGNAAWRSIHEVAHPDIEAIWVNKSEYFKEEKYRLQLWQQLAEAGYSMVVAPARTRPLLLDDAVAIASGAPFRIAGSNSLNTAQSNSFFTEIIPVTAGHELQYNQYLANAITNIKVEEQPLAFPLAQPKPSGKTILFIGASARSKRWPATNWTSLISSLKTAGHDVVLAGGPGDKVLEQQILERVPEGESIVAKQSLVESLETIAAAKLVISGDTMAAHAAVGAGVALVLLANGNNASRFTDYDLAKVKVLYPKRYLNFGKKLEYMATKADLASVAAVKVMAAVEKLGAREGGDWNSP